MDIFCTDIDNTIIYSHRRDLPGEKFTAEYLNGREQAFISAELFYILEKLSEKMLIIPVTMRTPEQYRRIFVPDKICRYAVVCGGAVLLDGDAPDREWNDNSLEIAGGELNSVDIIKNHMQEFTGGKNFHEYPPFMAYAKTDYPAELKKYLLDKKISGVNIFSDSRKVYCNALSLDKGSAVTRLREKFSAEKIISAGDGEQDISMLNNSDISIFPDKLSDSIRSQEKIISRGDFLSDDIIKYFSQIQ